MKFLRKSGSNFKRLVLVDEAVFEQLKKGAAVTPSEAARAYIQDQTTGYMEKSSVHDSDKLAVYDAMKLQREQLDRAASEIARNARKRKAAAAGTSAAGLPTTPAAVPAGASADTTSHSPHAEIGVGETDASDEEFEDADGGNGSQPGPSLGRATERLRVSPDKTTNQSMVSAVYHSQPLIRRKGPVALPAVEVPTQYENKCDRLKIMLEDTQRFRVDNAGRVVIDGATVSGSDYSKIIRSFFVTSTAGETENVGRTRMLVKMVDAGVQQDDISAPGAKLIMQRYGVRKQVASAKKKARKSPAEQSGNGPPGRKPKLLYVYRN